MIYELQVALIVVGLIMVLIMTFIIFQIYRMHRSSVEKMVFMLETFFFSLIFLYFITLLFPFEILYDLLLIVAATGFFLTVYGVFVILGGGGEVRPKKERVFMLLYVGIISIASLPFAFLNIRTETIDYHTYFGLSYPFLIGTAILILIPECYVIIIGSRKFFRLYEEKMRYFLIIFFVAFSSYIFSQFLIFLWIETRIYGAFLLISASIVGIALLKKDPNFLIRIGTSFAFKKIFLIKNNGQTIFSQDFAPTLSEVRDNKTVDYLIGGFIYAITHGIQEIIKQDFGNQLRSMDFGNLKMLFYYESQIFGVLFSTTINTLMYNKLRNFVDAFEKSFPELISNQNVAMLLEDQVQSEKNKETISKIKELLKIHFKF